MRNIAISILGAAALAACVSPDPIALPHALATAPDEMPVKKVHAKGVQIYECRAKGGNAEWAFVAPEADLFDMNGRPAGTHGAGPVWTALDGSTVKAVVKAKADAPAAGAIPWLLLAATPLGPDGSFGKVTSILRVNTVGGIAPAGTCEAGERTRVAYTADYLFFRVIQTSAAKPPNTFIGTAPQAKEVEPAAPTF